jgi:steroid 5-alpha reductase family enzyme
LVVCIGASCSVWQWIIAAIGYIGIVYVMFSGARRLELRQAVTYGNDPEFQEYIKKTPILLPFVPIYTLIKYEWLKA